MSIIDSVINDMHQKPIIEIAGQLVSIQELLNDIAAAKSKGYQPRDFCFTYETVQGLIDKIDELFIRG